MIQFSFWEQPAAGDLGAGHAALGHHFVDFTFLETEIAGGFGGREKLHNAYPAPICIFFDSAKNDRKNKAVRDGNGSAKSTKMMSGGVLALPRGLEPLFSP